MASPFERAFNPAFQQASAAAMKSLDDERQDKRFQQRMLEQRQYDAGLLAGSKEYAAGLLKDSRVYQAKLNEEERKNAAGLLANANFATLYKQAIEAGVPEDQLRGLTSENNQDIMRMIASETQGQQRGKNAQESGAGVENLEKLLPKNNPYPLFPGSESPPDFFKTPSPELRGWDKASSAYTQKVLDADRSTSDATELRGVVRGEGDQAALDVAKANFTAITGQPIPENATKAQLDEGVVAYNKNRTEGEEYYKAIALLEADQAKPLQGIVNKVNPITLELERGSLPAEQTQQVGEPIETLRRMTAKLAEGRVAAAQKAHQQNQADINSLADATSELTKVFPHLTAQDVAEIEGKGNAIAQRDFLIKNFEKVPVKKEQQFGGTDKGTDTFMWVRRPKPIPTGQPSAVTPVNPVGAGNQELASGLRGGLLETKRPTAGQIEMERQGLTPDQAKIASSLFPDVMKVEGNILNASIRELEKRKQDAQNALEQTQEIVSLSGFRKETPNQDKRSAASRAEYAKNKKDWLERESKDRKSLQDIEDMIKSLTARMGMGDLRQRERDDDLLILRESQRRGQAVPSPLVPRLPNSDILESIMRNRKANSIKKDIFPDKP